MTGIASKLGISPETLRIWVRRTEIDEGRRAGNQVSSRWHLPVLSDRRRRRPP